ncbi:MAG: DUF5714 domain-containing protein [Candidatus Ozemobacteraceae bacterium]
MRECPICNTPWQEFAGAASCLFCQVSESADFHCAKGHYVCEDCRTDDPRDLVLRVCDRSKETAPLALWNLVTAHGAFRTHGPQFHFALAPVLAAVLRNRGLLTVESGVLATLTEKLSEIPALSCAERGMCGVAATAGTIVSLLTHATPVSDKERRAALSATGKALLEIASHKGGRCCRQSSLTTLESVWIFLRNELALPLEPLEVSCRYSSQTADCKKECVYHG